ncbi:hypothetical protein TWF730_009009 [Orbilia blumenaviensis]|uniref:Uncharacterized protein n=1 Tax=Orbilia blumenaviensis TaxID=1796055 RepID=A0AAV9UX38_9PEZI
MLPNMPLMAPQFNWDDHEGYVKTLIFDEKRSGKELPKMLTQRADAVGTGRARITLRNLNRRIIQ